MVTRREALRRGMGAAAALSAGPFLVSCAPAGLSAATATAAPPTSAPTLPPPETASIRLTCAACDAPIMAAESFLREEGFTDVQITDAGTQASLTAGKADMGPLFPPSVANSLQSGLKIVGLSGIHPGCVEIWAQPGIASLKDLRGKTMVFRAKTLSDIGYGYTMPVLKQAGVDPKEVNIIAQADADPVKLFLEGKSDAVFVATTSAAALKANPANKGHVIHSQVMDEPWKNLDCCILATTEDWYRANPIAAKRAVRAIFRAADSLSADRANAVKLMTDKGLFGGSANFANVREAANMVPLDWRTSDLDKSMRFFAPLLAEAGSKLTADELAKAMDPRIMKELKTELKK